MVLGDLITPTTTEFMHQSGEFSHQHGDIRWNYRPRKAKPESTPGIGRSHPHIAKQIHLSSRRFINESPLALKSQRELRLSAFQCFEKFDGNSAIGC